MYCGAHWFVADMCWLNEDEQWPSSFVEWGDPLKSWTTIEFSWSSTRLEVSGDVRLFPRQRSYQKSRDSNRQTIDSIGTIGVFFFWTSLVLVLVGWLWLSWRFWPVIDWWIFLIGYHQSRNEKGFVAGLVSSYHHSSRHKSSTTDIMNLCLVLCPPCNHQLPITDHQPELNAQHPFTWQSQKKKGKVLMKVSKSQRSTVIDLLSSATVFCAKVIQLARVLFLWVTTRRLLLSFFKLKGT